jgi:hypothetical protein
MDFGVANVAAITMLTYIVGGLIKVSKLDNKWIPTICGVVGVVLGIVAFYIGVPDFPANDVITAAAVGAASGFAATGVNQVGKQLSDKEE